MKNLAAVAGRTFVALFLALSFCAPSLAAEPESNPIDPWEGFNRSMYSFNDGLDTYFLAPVAEGYVAVTPQPARTWVSNFFGNVGDVWVAVNSLLQGKGEAGFSDLGRVAINSTLGILGFFDIATEMGLERHDEDFGQTLAVWGVGNGPYLVLPLFGPSTVRDTGGLIVDRLSDPFSFVNPSLSRYGASALKLVNTRALYLGAREAADGAALDVYAYRRSFHLQRREYLIYDGNPPLKYDDE